MPLADADRVAHRRHRVIEVRRGAGIRSGPAAPVVGSGVAGLLPLSVMRSRILAALWFVGCSAPDGSAPSPASPEQPAPPATQGSQPPDPKAETPTIGPEPSAPVVVPDAVAAHAAVQSVVHGEALPEHDNVHFTPVEDPSGRALHAFHASLRDLQDHPKEGKKVRVAFYGASSVAADRYPGYLRGYLQQRFGDGGVGFVTLVPLWRWHRHDAVRLDANKHWKIEHGQRKIGKLDGYYGLLGASAHSTHKRARSTLHSKASAVSGINDSDSFAIQLLEQPGGGSFSVKFGTGKSATSASLATAAEAFALKTVSVPLPDTFTPMTIQAASDAEVRIMGGIFERDQSGVVVDALGIGGTRSANIVNWDVPMWSAALRDRAPSLYVLAYGANESVDEDEPIDIYRENLEAVLDRFAAAVPDASCVLVGPVDYPLKDEETETWGVRPRLREILTAQREIAAQRGCGFFDTSKLTGGLGSMPEWVAADPQLAKGDHLHLTPVGYTHFGRVLSDALMADFDGPPRVTP